MSLANMLFLRLLQLKSNMRRHNNFFKLLYVQLSITISIISPHQNKYFCRSNLYALPPQKSVNILQGDVLFILTSLRLHTSEKVKQLDVRCLHQIKPQFLKIFLKLDFLLNDPTESVFNLIAETLQRFKVWIWTHFNLVISNS